MRSFRIARATLLLVTLLVPGGPARAQSAWDLTYVPIGHWSYQVFDRLAGLGLVPLDAVTARPITRREARKLVGEALSRAWIADSEIIRLVSSDLQRLRQAFSVDPVLEIQGRGLAGNRATEFTPDRSLGVSSAAAGLALSGDWLLFGRVAGGDSPGDPPAGELYTSFQLGAVSFQLGRTSASWGPSLRTGLLLSDNAGTLPLFRLTAELPQARLTKIVASLERWGGAPPGPIVLFATRLDWMVTPRFRLGFNESLVTSWGAPLTFYDLLEPIPALSAVIASYQLHDILGQARDTTVAVDFDWLPQPGTRLYGVAFINDMPELILERLARIGLLAGVFLVDPWKDGRTSLRLEYSAVTNGTYSYPNVPVLAYEYGGRSLGHWLGPDGDDLHLEVSRRLNPSTDLQVSYAYTRHGQGRIGQPAPPPADWFLSGVVEYRHTFGFQLLTIQSPSFETRYRAEIASVTNQGNVTGMNGWEWLLGVELKYKWPVSSTEVALPGGVEFPPPAPSQEGQQVPQRAPNRLTVRHWSAAMTSTGPLSGPPESATLVGLVYRANMGDFASTFSYDSGDGQAFWSVGLHYPLVQFEHGSISVFAGWGGLTRHGVLGGTLQNLNLAGPRLGAEFFYQLAPEGVGTPFYLAGELSSPPLRANWSPVVGGLPFFYWSYNLGAGWQFANGLQVEAGYRGAAAVWGDLTPQKTILYWDGFYASVIFK